MLRFYRTEDSNAPYGQQNRREWLRQVQRDLERALLKWNEASGEVCGPDRTVAPIPKRKALDFCETSLYTQLN